ncbi:MAG: hypothetical protein AAGA92_02055 [Planctomycetota bacterium]
MHHPRALISWICMAALLPGCGGTPADVVSNREASAKACEEAEQAFKKGDFQTAKSKFEAAFEIGNLQLDLYAEALVKHAVCMAGVGEVEQAARKLDELEQQPIPEDLILSARSFVLEKQGKKRDAKLAWSRARKINRMVPKFDFK